MISETLKNYLPSKSYLEYLERIDHSFTDFEEASILCQVVNDVFLLHEELDKILLRTEDKTLKEQIEDYLREHVQEGDLILTVGAGDVTQVGSDLAEKAQG